MYETTEITTQVESTIRPYKDVIGWFKKQHKVVILDRGQNVAMLIYMRFKVKISLYLSRNSRARSLSTLMAVIVNKETTHNV